MRILAKLLLPCLCLLPVGILGACGSSSSNPPRMPESQLSQIQPGGEFSLAKEANKGVHDKELAVLLVNHWDETLRRSPVWAGTLGDHRYDTAISDNSAEAIAAERMSRRRYLKKAAEIHLRLSNEPQSDIRDSDLLTAELLKHRLRVSIDNEKCEAHKWSISARGNPIVSFNRMHESHKINNREDAYNLLARYKQIPRSVENSMAHLRQGAKEGWTMPRESLVRTIELIEAELAKPVKSWQLMVPAKRSYDKIKTGQLADFYREMNEVAQGPIRSAYAQYLTLLKEELLPLARSGDKEGISSMPKGAACYSARIRRFTDLSMSAEEIHKLGLREIEKINKEMEELGPSAVAAANLGEITKRLRSDTALYFEDEKSIVDAAEKALANARATIPTFFGILPKADCKVVKIPEVEAPFTTIAYYQQPHADGSKPGEYYINTYKPKTRPRFEMEVLAFHESIPGHHLQIAINQEQDALPAFRRFGGSTAFVEGWALYTERLSDEMELYSGPLDRMGMLSYDAWRAARLVVDTGIHAMGWTRKQAEDFMVKHTALTAANIKNEVDRYISWSGQALAYKLGQREIFALRAKAKRELADRFDIRRFHDAVLRNGALPLPVLRASIERWIAAEQAQTN